MNDLGHFLSFPATIAMAILLGRRWPDASRRVARTFALASVAILGCGIATGWRHDRPSAATAHRWLSHGLIILAWNAIPFTIGVVAARRRARPLLVVRDVLLALSVLVVFLLASMTGYLLPSDEPAGPNTRDRFRVLHCGAFPLLSLVLALAWYSILGPRRAAAPRADARPSAPC